MNREYSWKKTQTKKNNNHFLCHRIPIIKFMCNILSEIFQILSEIFLDISSDRRDKCHCFVFAFLWQEVLKILTNWARLKKQFFNWCERGEDILCSRFCIFWVPCHWFSKQFFKVLVKVFVQVRIDNGLVWIEYTVGISLIFFYYIFIRSGIIKLSR